MHPIAKATSDSASTPLAHGDAETLQRLRERIEQLSANQVKLDQAWPHATGPLGKLIDALRDLTRSHEQRVRESLAMVDQLRAILNHASIGITITRNGRFELVGQHICHMYGYTEQELIGHSTRMIYLSDESYAQVGQQVATEFRANGHFDGELLMSRKDGQPLWVHALGRAVVPGDPGAGTIWILEDITRARAAHDQLSWSATHDSLTLLANRREFENRLTQAMGQFAGHQLCVMFVDLDHFKAVNDSAGHVMGDEVLRQIARLLETQVRQSDTVARLGGDEFAVLLPGCTLTRAQQLAQQMCDAVRNWRLMPDGRDFAVGASIGLVAVTADLADLPAVMLAADTACYEAKRRGRGCVVTYSDLSGPAGAPTATPA